MTRSRTLDIAIVGMACRFPGARDVVAFWENVLAGRESIRDVPPDRWDPAVFFDPNAQAVDRVYSCRGGFLDAPIAFDPARHGVLPETVAGGEPEQFLILDAARAALADCGIEHGVPDGRRVEVVIGRGNYFNRGNLTRLQHGRILAQTLAILRDLHPDWTDAELEAVRADLRSGLPPFGPSTIPGQLTNATAGRVANRLDLSGASYVVDAASASALVALDLGTRSLVERRADLALVGAVYLAADVDFPMVFAQLGALSRSGSARPFTQNADGMIPGEGVGVVVLKRLSDAERDGDRIYAVLKGIGLASDGRRQGLATPSARGHARAIRRAYRRSGIDPATVGLVEGHGLGVPAADRAELRALNAVFPPQGQVARTLGAVSALIGHAMPAAGMAGLIKTALALHHRVIPPSPHADPPNPLLEGSARAFSLAKDLRPWIHGGPPYPRRAGVNAFGFAGISAHAILEEHAPSAEGPRPSPMPPWDTEAILIGAADRTHWLERAQALADWLGRDANQAVRLRDLAYSLNTEEAASGPFRVGLVVASPAELRERLTPLIARIADPACRSIRDARGTYFWEEPLSGPGTLAFLYPGEGSQYPRMLADLCGHFPEVRRLFDTADRIAREHGAARLPSDVVFGAAGAQDDLWTVGTGVNVVLSSQWALHQLLLGLELAPDAVVGHSSGEFLAIAAAGALSVDRQVEDQFGALGKIFEDLETSGRIPHASLLAIATDRARVEAIGRDLGITVTVAMDNCPHQVVVAGTSHEVEALTEQVKAQGIPCERLPFERAYHTEPFRAALGPIQEFFDALPLTELRARLYSCATAKAVPANAAAIRQLAVEQWAREVAFRRTIETMHDEGVRIFVEVGARGNLTGFVDDILRNRPHYAVAVNLPRRSGLTQLNHLVASLFAQRVPFRPHHLYRRRSPVRIDLTHDLPPVAASPSLEVGFPQMRLSPDLAERLRQHAPPAAGPSLAHAHDNGFAASAEPHQATLREQAMFAHLQTMDAFLETQRQVMSAFHAARAQPVATTAETEHSPTRTGPTTSWPWLGEVVEREAGRRLRAFRTLIVADDPVAEHHTLGGRRVSVLEPLRKGLPVVPFTVMAEMLAQAASALLPEQTVVALRDVQAHRWIRYEADPVTLEIVAEHDPGSPLEVHVEIYNRGTHAADVTTKDGPVVVGTVSLAASRPQAALAPPFALDESRTCRFKAEEIYVDQWLFHGPALQAVSGIGLASPHGIEGTLRILPRAGLLASGDPNALHTDPIVLDAFTHILGCWGMDEFPWGEGDVIFPLRVAEILLMGDDPPEGTDVACRVSVREVTRHRIRVDADLVRPDGRLWTRIVGWEDWRFYWPSRFRDQFRMPDRVFVGEALELPPETNAASSPLCAVWLEPPADMAKPVWRDVLEWVQLTPGERSAIRSTSASEQQLTHELWGRVAAKEAARRLWQAAGASPVYPGDLVFEINPTGRAHIRSLLDEHHGETPAAVFASAGGVAIALASLAHDAQLGVGIESLSEPPDAPDEGVAGHQDILKAIAEQGHDPVEWAARFRVARCALLAAMGASALETLIIVVDADPHSGAVVLRRSGESGSMCLFTARRSDYVWCACQLEP